MTEELHPAVRGLGAILPAPIVRQYSRIAYIQDVRCPSCGVGLGRRCQRNDGTFCPQRIAAAGLTRAI